MKESSFGRPRWKMASGNRSPAAAIAACILLLMSGRGDAFEDPSVDSKRAEKARRRGLLVRSIPVTVDDPGPSQVITADRELAVRYREARQLVAQREFGAAIDQLQVLLDLPEDAFISIGDDVSQLGMKGAAEQLVGEIVQRDEDLYERLYGAKARQILNRANVSGDLQPLHDVAHRFFHTRAGRESTYRLGSFYFDHNKPLLAAACFQRLRSLTAGGAADWSKLSLRLALSRYRAGDVSSAREILLELRSSSTQESVTIGAEKIAWFEEQTDPLDWLARHFESRANEIVSHREEHPPPLPEIRPAGFSRAKPSAHSAASVWTVPAFSGTEQTLKSSLGLSENDPTLRVLRSGYGGRGSRSLNQMSPIIAAETVICRTLGDLTAVDLRTGRPRWRSPIDPELKRFVTERKKTKSNRAPHTVLKLINQRQWDDATYGIISSDGQRVYSIEGLSISRPFRDVKRKSFIYPSPTNRLAARDVRTGELIWERDGDARHDRSEPPETFFLGAPLAIEEQLYCLADSGSRIQLLVLDAHTGAERWSQTVAMAGIGIAPDFYRRMAGLQASYQQGIVICPTGVGSLVAVDAETRSLLWEYSVTESDNPEMPPPADPRIRVKRHENNYHRRWWDSSATIVGRQLLVKLRGSNKLHCLNLRTGKVEWKSPLDQRLFLAGVSATNVMLAGRSQVSAVRLQDGESAWKQPLPIHPLSGRGFVRDDRLYLPMITGEVAIIDSSQGTLVAKRSFPLRAGLGNLARYKERLISQNVRFVSGLSFSDLSAQEVALLFRPVVSPKLLLDTNLN